jgi:hypothetical protein
MKKKFFFFFSKINILLDLIVLVTFELLIFRLKCRKKFQIILCLLFGLSYPLSDKKKKEKKKIKFYK